MTGLLSALIAVLALAGAPLFVVVFLLTWLLYATATDPIDIANIFIVMGDLMEKPFLLPIPLFTLGGFFLAESKAPQRVVRLADALCGWLPGGLAIVTICTLAFFTTFTGASGVTIIALGGLLWPLLKARGYPEGYSLGAITSSGSVGLLFFPSLPVFLYVTVLALSTGGRVLATPEHLFMAGLFPGLLMVGVLVIHAMWVGVARDIPRHEFSAKEALAAFKGAFWEASLPLWIILLLQSGQIGLLDIATVTVAYLFIVEVFIYRDLHIIRDVPRVVANAMPLVGAIVVILALILGLNNYLVQEEIPQRILLYLQTHIDSQLGMLLALNVFLLAVGCIMDIFSALVAVLPVLIPLATAYDIHPLHLGVIFLANLQVGYITPPVGMNLFISALHFKRPILQVARTVIPFMLLLLISVIAITYIKPLSLWLPAQFGAPGLSEDADMQDTQETEDLLQEMEDDDLDQYLDDEEEPEEEPDDAEVPDETEAVPDETEEPDDTEVPQEE